LGGEINARTNPPEKKKKRKKEGKTWVSYMHRNFRRTGTVGSTYAVGPFAEGEKGEFGLPFWFTSL
jgi:hypothetical protein